MARIASFLICILTMTVSLNTNESLTFNKHVFAQGLQHTLVDQKESISKEENNEDQQTHEAKALENAEIKFTAEDQRDVTHFKTVTLTKVIDSERLLTKSGDVVFLEALYIAKDDDNDIKTKVFIETHFLNKEVDLYMCKPSKCKKTDRYGHLRVHAALHKDKTWLQAALLATGHAQIRTRSDWPVLITRLQDNENYAREEQNGIWQKKAFAILNADAISDTLRGFRIVEGKIRSVAMHKNIVYLNFGDNWRKDFTVVIPSTIRRKFSKSGIDIMGKGGQTLRVRGWVDSYNGPYFEIDHIEQIEWLD